MPGALVMEQTRSLIRAHTDSATDTPAVAKALNRELEATSRHVHFVTLFLTKLDPESRRLAYCNAGHCPGLLMRHGTLTALEVGGMPLGAEASAEYEEGVAQLESGDVLLLYTDGLTEAFSPEGDVFGLKRLQNALLATASGCSPQQVIDAITSAVDGFKIGAAVSDDITSVCLVAE